MVLIWTKWVRICSTINRFFEKFFARWTGIVSEHPAIVITVSLLIALGFMAGFARFKAQSQTERLYFPEHSQSKDDLERAKKSFSQEARFDEFIIMMGDERASVLNNKTVAFALKLHKEIMSKTGIETICIKTRDGECFVNSILELFKYNESMITNIETTILNAYKNKKYIMQNGRTVKISLSKILGSLRVNASTIYSNALRVTYVGVFPTTDDVHKQATEVQQRMIDILQNGEKEAAAGGMKLFFQTGRSIDDGINESSGGDISLVAVSITLMCIFSTTVLICFRDKVGGHVYLGLVGVGCIALGIGAGFGLVMLSGQYFVAFVGTLPFLVLGVGIDDMFILIDGLDGMPEDITGIERLKGTMSKFGASVTMTTITDIVAFAISSSTDFPAIRYFCFYAMTTILLSFLLLMTVFLAAMTLDLKRIESGKLDLLCCKKSKSYVPWKKTGKTASKKIMQKWAELLMKTPTRIIVVILSLALLGGGIYGTTQLEEKFDVRQLVPDDSYFIDFLDKYQENFPVGWELYIINDNPTFDYTNPQNQQNYVYLDTIVKENEYLVDTTINWMTALLNSTIYKNNVNLTFYQKLNMFLVENPVYNSDLIFDGTTKRIKYSRIQTFDRDVSTWDFRKKSMLQIREDLEEKSKISSPNDVYAITQNFFYREQMVAVPKETVQNLVLCSVAILIITTPYLVHPLVILIVFGGFVALVFELFGLMVIWGVSLNSISMITSIMAIGFAVDYSAHVAHSYMLATGDTAEERMINALREIGASVFMGGFTTFLGILVLIFGNSEIFRIFFKMVFGIVVLGLLNGLVILPVYLSLLVRTKVRIRDDETKDSRSSYKDNNKVREKNVIENPNVANRDQQQTPTNEKAV